ncbi:hypothetical protein HQ520_13975, partial [bacterium]|nr:hypothetical protein [bacterium]
PQKKESPPSPPRTPSDELTPDEQDLLQEIMTEMRGDESPEEEASEEEEAVVEQTPEDPEKNADVLGDDQDLLAEVMREAEPSKEPASKNSSPEIPREKDGKSEEDAIDDILKQIEGLVDDKS